MAGTSTAWAQYGDLGVPAFGNSADSPFRESITAPETRDQGVLHDITLTRDLPYVPPPSRARRDYNLKLGDATALFSGSLAANYTDNALQGPSSNRHDDFTLTPSVNVAVDMPLTENNSFRVDVGIGYRYSLNYSELSTLYIAPRSAMDYRIRVGDVLVTFFDLLSTTADTLQRVDLRANGAASGVDFNRLNNQAGLSVAYDVARDTSVVAGYSFAIDRGLNDAYSYYNSNVHTFNAALYHRLDPRFTVGLASTYFINDLLETRNALSSSRGWSVGPVFSVRPSSFLNLSASVRYTSIDYDKIGGIAAASDPGAVVFDLGASHEINRSLRHSLNAARSFNNSLLSAQMETYTVDYNIAWNALRNTTVFANAGWQRFKNAGNSLSGVFPSRDAAITALTGLPQRNGALITAADAAAIYDFYSYQDSGDNVHLGLGTSYQFTRKLVGSLAYSHTIRTSEAQSGNLLGAAADFNANVVSLNLGYRF